MNFSQIRQKYPEYNDMSDDDFAQAFHKKFYSDMPYADFSQKIGYSTKQKPDDVLGTRSAYERYLADYQQRQTRPLIPGEQPPEGPPLSEKDWTSERNKEMAKTIASPLDVGLSLAMKLPAMMAAGPAAIWAAVRGGDPEKTVANVIGGPKWTDPKSEAGEKLFNKVGEILQPFGLAPYVHIGQVGARGAVGKPFAKDVQAKIADKLKKTATVTETPTKTTKSFADLVAEEDQPTLQETIPIVDNTYKRYQHGFEQPDTDAQQVKLLEQELAQQTIEARQRALEQEVAKRQSLDFNAAERARQEAAPTGYESWVEAQRQNISGDPGVNDPIAWPRKVADRYPEMTTSLPEGRPDYGGIDPGINDARSLPIEIADALRTGDVPQDPFNRYSPQQAANRILREGEHPPIIKGRGPARGAIDARVFEDLYKFGKSVVRGEDGNLMPVYHGTTKEKQGFNPIRGLHETTKYEGNLGSWFSSTPKGTDTFSGARTGVSGGNVHQVYLNITNPKVFNTHQEFKQWFDSQPGSTNKIRRELIKQGHDGIEITLSNTDGGGIRTDFVAFHPEQIESAISPGTYKNKYAGRFNKQRGAIFLPKKREGQEVTKILNLKNTPYNRVQSVEEVLDNPGKDLSPILRGTKDALQSGLEGTLRHNTTNAGINFTRTKFQEARNYFERLSKQYLTDSKTGLNAELNKLNTKQKTDVVGLMLELDRQQKPLTESVMDRAGFNEQQKIVARRMVEANDALYANKTAALGEQGYDAHRYRQGYMPGNFGGAYRTLIGYKDKDGNFHITGVAQADTKLGHTKALEWYRNQKNDKFSVEIDMGRQGIGNRVYSSAYDGWADLVQAVAKHDPDFKKVLDTARQVSKDAVASLYDFQVHEKAKKGITGSYGNRPWLTPEQNAKEFLRSYIDYLEEGFKYTAYQNSLNEINKLVMDPGYRSSHPRTVKYLEKYVKHVTGHNLNPIGAAVNWAIDNTARAMGLGNNQFTRVNRELTQASTLHMMGVFNPGFFLAQLTQWATGGIPEAAQIRATLKQDPQIMLDSLSKTITDITALNVEESLGRKVKDVPKHIRDAWKWGHDNGLFTFSEVALAHQVLQSKVRRKVEPYLDWPIRLGEQATRPTVFLTFVDMFNKAGFQGEEAFLRAQTATDWAMVNYHPDERPMIYQSLGALGNSLGALSTYKHNLVSQWGARTKDAAKNPAALAIMLGVGFGLYGIAGFPGYQEMSEMSEKLTGKPIRELVLDNPKDPNSVMDGALSAYTATDFQSRLSMSSVLPDSPLSAFPHISNFFNIMDKAYDAGMNWDKGAGQELAKALAPAGTRGFLESAMYPDGNILDKNAKMKYDTPRTPEQQMVRNILGTRPLRERLQDERVWSTRKSEAKRAEDMKSALARFDRAYLLADNDGMAKAEEAYTNSGGDLSTLYSGDRLRSLVTTANMSEPDRRAGKPTKNLNTIKRYEEFTK